MCICLGLLLVEVLIITRRKKEEPLSDRDERSREKHSVPVTEDMDHVTCYVISILPLRHEAKKSRNHKC